jgi:hypothetical protein
MERVRISRTPPLPESSDVIDNAIQNVGEYYAAHYLAESFAEDIADQVKAWKAQGSQTVPRRLQALSDLYLAYSDQYRQHRRREPAALASPRYL